MYNISIMKNEILIEKHTKKSWFKSAVLGLFMGLAVIIPGVSGAQIAILFKLYDKFTYAISKILKQFKTMFLFLLPIAIGLVIGFVAGFLAVETLIELAIFAVVALFAGMMLGGIPVYVKEINFKKLNWLRILLIIVGLIIPITISCVSVALIGNDGIGRENLTEWYMWILALPIGFVVAVTQIIPGLSATSILLSIGVYKPIIDSVSLSFLKENPTIIVFFLMLIVGFVVGLFILSKLITKFIEKYKENFYCLALGLSISSIVAMFYNTEMVVEYDKWTKSGIDHLQLRLGLGLFVIGAIGIFLLFYFSNKKEQKIETKLEAEEKISE